MNARLELRGIRKAFPGTRALWWNDADVIGVRPGEIHGLVGENGAGKSTLFQAIMGIYPLDGGSMTFEGEAYEPRNFRDAERAGISIIMQQPNTFENMTVAENIFAGRDRQFQTAVKTLRTKQQVKAAQAILDATGFATINAGRKLCDLSFEERKEVEIARALSAKPKVLLVDETSAAVSREAVETLFDVIRRQRDLGVSVIYISHFIEEVFELCDRASVLRDGRLISTRVVAEVNPRQIIEDMVGRDLSAETYRATGAYPDSTPALKTTGFSGEAFENVDFEVDTGAIVGIAGIGGCGSEEFGRAVFGSAGPVRGRLELFGRPVHFHNAGDALAHGVGYIPKDRDREGLVAMFNIVQNVSSANLRNMSTFGWMRSGKEQSVAKRYIDAFRIKTPSPETKVASLSGGNRQKVVMAKWVANSCDVLVVNSPTRGVDVGAKYEIYKILDELRMAGKAIVVISDDLPELVGLCDRLYTFRSGRVSGIFDRSEGFPMDAILTGMVSGGGLQNE